MLETIRIMLQQFLPRRWITEVVGWGVERCGKWLTHKIIFLFVRIYKVDIQEAQNPNIADYSTFNDFFVRRLRDDARPIATDPSIIVMPADGMISQLGSINGESLFQAKGHVYRLKDLLAGNESIVTPFINGRFVTIYLAPKDYHRVHMPCNGVLREMLYIPGELFSVNPLAVDNIPNLFARNERIICVFDTDFGPIAQILIGATIVGSIETVWSGTVIPPRTGMIKHWCYPQANAANAVVLIKGQEMGLFKLGSTVINLFSSHNVLLSDHLYPRYVTRIGQRMAYGIALNRWQP